MPHLRLQRLATNLPRCAAKCRRAPGNSRGNWFAPARVSGGDRGIRESVILLRREFETLGRDYHGAAERLNSEIGNLWKSAEQATRGIGDLWHRIEFVRREIMYEFKYGLTNKSAMEKSARISPEKIDKARATGVRLNLGCGHILLDGYINIDQRELPGVDIVSDVGNLPFAEHSLSEIFSAHMLEHLPQERLRRLLPYWCSLLGPNGTFRAVVPDGEACSPASLPEVILLKTSGRSYSGVRSMKAIFTSIYSLRTA